MRTQVGIVGAGPAGLLLSHLLHLAGIRSVVVEAKSRQYVEERVRAGVLEQPVVDLLRDVGLGGRMPAVGIVHDGTELRFGGAGHRIDFKALTGKAVMVYAQHEVVHDLIEARLAAGGELLFECDGVRIDGITGAAPTIHFTRAGKAETIEADFIAGCDGFHGICRPAIPSGVLTAFDRVYPFGWLGILAEAPPVSHELIYASHPRGFALASMRSPRIVRHYIQCAADEDLAQWPDERIWDELEARLDLGSGRKLVRGPLLQKGVTGMRSFVVEPMQHGRLFLAGDAAHIVPPTGAKGLNLAAGDVFALARAFDRHYLMGKPDALEAYSRTVLPRIWHAERFSWWMTNMLHRFEADTIFDRRVRLSELEYVTGSRAGSTLLAEQYVGLPLPTA